MATHSTLSPAGSVWGPRLGRWTVSLTVLAVVIAGAGLTLARYDLIAKLQGFMALGAGGLMALIAVLLGLAALIAGRKTVWPGKRRVIAALAVSALFAGFLVSRPMTAGEAPAIHDITTDLANPPQFQVLPLRADNLAGVGTVENWRKVHAAAYGRLGPITLAGTVPEVTAKALRLAQDAGWKVARSDVAGGQIEATASVSYIRFQDDVVIRITPVEGGQQSRVDMRSVSRVGVGDLGVNARRIRDFLEALSKV